MHKADGGGIDDTIDASGESFPGGIRDVMSNRKAAMDRAEVDAGKRFSDTGTRIPGRLKAKNDDYDRKLKARN